MQKLRYFTKETLNNLWQYRARNIFSITIICLSFLIIGIFLSLSNNLQHIAEQMSRNMAVIFFLEQNISNADIKELEDQLQDSDLVERVTFISTRQAREKFMERYPDLSAIVESVEINPFPPSLEASLKQSSISDSRVNEFIRIMQNNPGITDVQFNQEWVERIQSFSRLVKAIGFFLGGILILASFFIISNVIKLNVLARKDEIDILRLTGGTNMFIRIPFLAEGIILGFAGGLLSLILLFFLILLFPIYLGTSLGVLNELINFRYLSLGQCFGIMFMGAVIGSLGSMSSLARFLKT